MKVSWIVKANFLILSLGLIVYIMFQMKTSGLPPTFLSVLGISPPPATTAHIHKDTESGNTEQLTWCQTRVQSMESPSGFKIYQDKLKWLTGDSNPREVNFLDVEKWFGRNCSLKIKPLGKATTDINTFQTALIVNFIKGGSERFLNLPQEPHIYSWKGQVFRSPQLKQALDQLKTFSGSKPDLAE